MRKMKCYSTVLSIAIVGLSGGLTVLEGQEPSRTDKTTTGSNVGQLDPITSGASIRASKLIGMNIHNSQGESVGKVNDIVIDSRTGKIRYAAVTYGGFLGVGNKMFAVPFEAFKVGSAPNQATTNHLILDVAAKQLEGSMGFDEEHWPDFADQKLLLDLDRRYKVDRRIHVDVNRNGVDVKVDPTKASSR